MITERLKRNIMDFYKEADPLDHRVIINRDVLLGWANEVGRLGELIGDSEDDLLDARALEKYEKEVMHEGRTRTMRAPICS